MGNDREIRLFAVMRNEALRLPYWLEHYRALGVDRMFIVDNGSDDETADILASAQNVQVFNVAASYTLHWLWIVTLLERHGKGHWCLLADADEILSYPQCDVHGLKELAVAMEREDSMFLRCRLLDMYSDVPITRTIYRAGEDPFLACPFYDSGFTETHRVFCNPKSRRKYVSAIDTGNMRKRVFGMEAFLTKIPLFYYEDRTWLSRGTHSIDSNRPSRTRGVVHHFKFFSDFTWKAPAEAKRGVYYNNAIEYKAYAQRLAEDALCLYHSGSRRFRGWQSLVDDDVMKVCRGAW